MIVFDKLLAKGVGFVLEQVARAADAEQGGEERLREQLLEARLRFETGELMRDEFEEIEARLLAALGRLRRERRPGAIEARRAVVEIDAPELIFRNDARVLAHVRRRRIGLAKLIERVAGCYEWGLRIRHERRAPPPPPSLTKASSGTAFLRRKHQAVLARHGAAAVARERSDAAFAALAGAAAANRRKEEASGELARSILLEAAFLVPVARTKRFRALAGRAARQLERAGCDLTLSGPWPPYHFLD